MKRYDNFGDYMFDLLFAPLKKGKEAANQFRIFFRVIGKDFDDVKKAFFRVRDEANVVSASPVMLPVHGQDRDNPEDLHQGAQPEGAAQQLRPGRRRDRVRQNGPGAAA